MTSWTHMDHTNGWEAWEKSAAEMGEVVKGLKTSGGDKDAITAAVAELMHRKKKTKLGEALTAAIAAAPDAPTKEFLNGQDYRSARHTKDNHCRPSPPPPRCASPWMRAKCLSTRRPRHTGLFLVSA